MAFTYFTKSGDTWDFIAFKQMGSCKYLPELLRANYKKLDNFVFSAGEELTIPDVDKIKKSVNLPPWKVKSS